MEACVANTVRDCIAAVNRERICRTTLALARLVACGHRRVASGLTQLADCIARLFFKRPRRTRSTGSAVVATVSGSTRAIRLHIGTDPRIRVRGTDQARGGQGRSDRGGECIRTA